MFFGSCKSSPLAGNATISSNRFSDRIYLLVLIAYLGVLLCFSSWFYLATEDYEAILAVRSIKQGLLIGRSTGWPYTPLAPYFFYLYSTLFGENILGFRVLTACLLLISIVPIYFTLRSLCTPFLSFALTFFSFSLTIFPHPRLEYYIEAAFLSFAIYFAVRVIRFSKQRDAYLCAPFLLAAFASRGYPNTAILVGLVPLALVVVQQAIKLKPVTSEQTHASPHLLSTPRVSGLVLFLCCTGFFTSFLKKTVYNGFFFEYARISGSASFQAIKEFRNLLGLVLLGVLGIIYLTLSWRNKFTQPFPGPADGEPRETSLELKAHRILTPFALCGLAVLLIGASVGYPLKDLFFFFFPLDVFLDHVGQVRSGLSYVIPLFLSLGAMLLFMQGMAQVNSKKARIALFLILLLPSTFTRFFPTYNLLYLISFALAAFTSLIVPLMTQYLFQAQNATTTRIQYALGIFLILFATGSNLLLSVATQVSDLLGGRLLKTERGAASGIFVERDIVDYFNTVDSDLKALRARGKMFVFLSNRYLKYVPLIYSYDDILAGQNLTIGLGKLWSYDDVIKVNGIRSGSKFEPNGMIYNWRKAAVERMEEFDADTIVMSLYDPKMLSVKLEPSSDPFREYLRKNFVFVKAIEPSMKIHRRSAFSEGTVIFVRRGP